ncbi:MAG: hypothetical protein MJY82_03090 [Fibrobacter sp.]|nr:hypothetical protein [Fibrobacter sp.]
METEYTVTGKILGLKKSEAEPIEFEGFHFNIKPCAAQSSAISLSDPTNAQSVSEATLTRLCQLLSKRFNCKVYLCKGAETYGNANVFNGGSDYEIVSEKWFLCVFENGHEILCETTDHWNPM